MSRKHARVGVIGCGWWATHAHLPALAGDSRATIAGIAEPDPVKRAATVDRFAVPAAFANADELLAQVELDAVVIAIPHAFHFSVAKLALERGLHVLLEKPMTLEPEHARALLREARARGRELLIGYTWHYNRQVLAVREAIAAGEIGGIEFASCLFASIVREFYRGKPDAYAELFGYTWNAPGESTYSDPAIAGGGQGQTQVTHACALLFFLTGLRPAEVFAYAESFELPVDLADAITVRFEGGAIASLASTGSVTPVHEGVLEYRIFGREGHVLFDVTGAVCSIHRADGSTRPLPSLDLVDRYPKAAPAKNLVGVTLGEEGNGSPPEFGVMAVEFLDAMYRSAREGGRARVGDRG